MPITDEIQKVEGDSTPKGQDSLKPQESNSEKTHTESELKKAIEDAVAQYGDRIKREKLDPITVERDTYKTQAESNAESLKETQEKITELESELEELSQDDPERKNFNRRLKTFEAKEKALTDERDALEKRKADQDVEWKAKQERVTQAEETNFEIALWDLVEEYEGGDAFRLKNACEKAKIHDIDGAKGLAEALWNKKAKQQVSLVEGPPDSGGTTGGQETFESIRDAYNQNPNDPRILASYKEARRKRGL